MAAKQQANFPLDNAHKWFSTRCFNATWKLLELESRTPEQEDEMLRLATASHYHWTMRDDYSPDKASIAHWMLSRVYAVLGEAGMAKRHGESALGVLGPEPEAFLIGYGHEALARAAAVRGDVATRDAHVALAECALKAILHKGTRLGLTQDLASLR